MLGHQPRLLMMVASVGLPKSTLLWKISSTALLLDAPALPGRCLPSIIRQALQQLLSIEGLSPAIQPFSTRKQERTWAFREGFSTNFTNRRSKGRMEAESDDHRSSCMVQGRMLPYVTLAIIRFVFIDRQACLHFFVSNRATRLAIYGASYWAVQVLQLLGGPSAARFSASA